MTTIDAPGTCHLVGCEGKGTVDEHVRKPIGARDTFAPYDGDRCVGTPHVNSNGGEEHLFARCSIAGAHGWAYDFGSDIVTPRGMAAAVDSHREHCTNRSPR